MGKKKGWKDKLAAANPPHVVTLDKAFAGVAAGKKLAIASPLMVKAYVEQIPRGHVASMLEMRQAFAKGLGADATCPTSSAIFLRIVAEAALEDIAAGTKAAAATPFWRIVDPRSVLAQKLSCGPDFVAHMRAIESIAD